MKQLIYAHTGASGYAPENTMRSFQLACDMKADGVELDVQLSKDGEIVVIHDETVDRVTGMTGRVMDMTAAELSRLSVIHSTDGRPTDHIPLLKDVLALLHEHGLRVNIELKNNFYPYPGMEEKLMRLVEDTGMKEHTLYSSFNQMSMHHIKQLDPTAKCGLLYHCVLIEPWRYAAAHGMDALHPHYTELKFVPHEVEQAHALGIQVNPWTVNEVEDLRYVIAMGADVIITNYPDVAREVLNSLNSAK